MGVASTKVLKGVMEAENQEENSPERSSGKLSQRSSYSRHLRRRGQEGSEEARAPEEAKKARPLG